LDHKDDHFDHKNNEATTIPQNLEGSSTYQAIWFIKDIEE
jgi:hypothetical protein